MTKISLTVGRSMTNLIKKVNDVPTYNCHIRIYYFRKCEKKVVLKILLLFVEKETSVLISTRWRLCLKNCDRRKRKKEKPFSLTPLAVFLV